MTTTSSPETTLLHFFGLREQPFGVTPDPRFFFESDAHREALASLFYGIETGRGFLAIVAEAGSGKTTLLFHLLQRFQHSGRTAFLFQTQCNSEELIGQILGELGLPYSEPDIFIRHELLNQELLRRAKEGNPVILVIDEAQNLAPEVLETVRLLSNFESQSLKLLQIVLAGQPQLADKLADPRLEQLRQRVSILIGLRPFSLEETHGYIQHRLRIAGSEGQPSFAPAAVALIHSVSEGIPRNINTYCYNALALAFALQQTVIDENIVREVAADLDLDQWRSRPEPDIEAEPVPPLAPVSDPESAGRTAEPDAAAQALESSPPPVETPDPPALATPDTPSLVPVILAAQPEVAAVTSALPPQPEAALGPPASTLLEPEAALAPHYAATAPDQPADAPSDAPTSVRNDVPPDLADLSAMPATLQENAQNDQPADALPNVPVPAQNRYLEQSVEPPPASSAPTLQPFLFSKPAPDLRPLSADDSAPTTAPAAATSSVNEPAAPAEATASPDIFVIDAPPPISSVAPTDAHPAAQASSRDADLTPPHPLPPAPLPPAQKQPDPLPVAQPHLERVEPLPPQPAPEPPPDQRFPVFLPVLVALLVLAAIPAAWLYRHRAQYRKTQSYQSPSPSRTNPQVTSDEPDSSAQPAASPSNPAALAATSAPPSAGPSSLPSQPASSSQQAGSPLQATPTPSDQSSSSQAGDLILQLSSDVLFGFGQVEILPASRQRLDRVAQQIRRGSGTQFEIRGYSDSAGSPDVNLQVSARRADAVKQYLVKRWGIDERLLVTRGLGNANPVAPNQNSDGTDNPAGRQRNRRVEISALRR